MRNIVIRVQCRPSTWETQRVGEEALIERLRLNNANGRRPSEVISRLIAEGPRTTQLELIRLLKPAFPKVPLGVLIDASAYCGLGQGERR